MAAYLDIITGHVEPEPEPFAPVYAHDDFDDHYGYVDYGDIGDYGPIAADGE